MLEISINVEILNFESNKARSCVGSFGVTYGTIWGHKWDYLGSHMGPFGVICGLFGVIYWRINWSLVGPFWVEP